MSQESGWEHLAAEVLASPEPSSALQAERTSAAEVAVIVLNWNGRDDTLACLESLRAVAYQNFHVTVVDNGSTDGSAGAIRRQFPDVALIETGRNLGFAGGNNVGIRNALQQGADYIFLLNNDTVVAPSLLQELVSAAARCPERGIFTARIYYYAQPERIWSAGVQWLRDRMEFRHVQDDAVNSVDQRGVAQTDYACGCALFARSTIFRDVGLLDAKFFLTYEETDFCYRARRAGIPSYYVPSAVLWHKVSVSFGGSESPLIKYFITRNRLLWGERHLTRRELLQLYKRTWWEIHGRLKPELPPDAAPIGALRRCKQLAQAAGERWKDPETQAMAWGVLHYVLRRFGDASPRVRKLARPRQARDSSR